MVSKIIRKVRNYVWTKKRIKINDNNKKRLSKTGENACIFSSNCNGGIISHDLGLRFLSPTVNLFMRAEDFIKFCENPEYYLSIDEMVECRDEKVVGNRTYPVAFLGDLTLFLVHYSSVKAAQEKWNERKKRIDPNNIVIMNTDREGMTDELKDRFERLPYRKVMFTHLPDDKHPSCFYIKGYEDSSCVGIITDHDTWDGKRPIDQFDYVRFLNGEG